MNSGKNRKISQNSITSLLQQKAKLNLSPSHIDCTMTPQSTTGKHELLEQQLGHNSLLNKPETHYNIIPSPLIKPNKILMEPDDELISKLNYANTTANIGCSKFPFNRDDIQHNFNSFSQNSEKIMEPKRSYYRDIQIKTEGLERVYPNNINLKDEKEKNTIFKSPSDVSQNNFSTPNSSLTTKVQKISFKFSEKLFDHRSPTSQDRSYWFCQFLMKKLGEEKFEKIKQLLENSPNPMQIITEQRQILIEIMGEENQDCVRMLKCLISSAVTPTSDMKKPIKSSSSSAKSKNDDINKAFSFDKIIKSPLSANYPSSMNNLSFGATVANINNSEEIKENNKISCTRKTPERPMIIKDSIRSPTIICIKNVDNEMKVQEYTSYFNTKNSNLLLSTKKN